MHSLSTRLNGIMMYTGIILAIACGINFVHGYLLYDPKVDVTLQINSVSSFIKISNWDQAAFKYTLHADLSPLYNWNLKQLYVYIEFQWVDPVKNLTSKSIGTDWVLQLPQDRSQLKEKWTLDVKESRMDYLLRDVYFGLPGNTIKMSLNVQYMPVVGIFFNSRLYQTTYAMPQNYTNAGTK